MDILELQAEKNAAYYSQLAERAKTERAAFSELYDYYFPRVYNFIFGKVKNRDTADDVASITFEKMLTRLDSFDSQKGAFSTWIFRIASNEVNNVYRQGSYQHEAAWEDFFDPADQRKSPEQEALTVEGCSELLKALDQLAERERQVVSLKYFSELGNKEIAEQLAITPSNVGVILYRSLDKLKNILAKNY